jgi:hypothetical protein
VARRSRMASAFGARFDMEVDALLMMAISILVWQYARRDRGFCCRDSPGTSSSWPDGCGRGSIAR